MMMKKLIKKSIYEKVKKVNRYEKWRGEVLPNTKIIIIMIMKRIGKSNEQPWVSKMAYSFRDFLTGLATESFRFKMIATSIKLTVQDRRLHQDHCHIGPLSRSSSLSWFLVVNWVYVFRVGFLLFVITSFLSFFLFQVHRSRSRKAPNTGDTNRTSFSSTKRIFVGRHDTSVSNRAKRHKGLARDMRRIDDSRLTDPKKTKKQWTGMCGRGNIDKGLAFWKLRRALLSQKIKPNFVLIVIAWSAFVWGGSSKDTQSPDKADVDKSDTFWPPCFASTGAL